MSTIDRRLFLQGLAGLGALSCLSFPGMAFANARTDQRLVVVILRGGMDGLAAVAPYGDPNYRSLRQGLSLETDSLLRLDNMFGLHPAFAPLHEMYMRGELAVVHAVASPYRERSHFDAQNVLELGSSQPNALESGWLNRLAGAIDSRDRKLGMAISQTLPLMMRGDQYVGSWAPSGMDEVGDDYYSLVSKIYAKDPIFAKALNEGLDVQQRGADLFHEQNDRQSKKMARQSRGGQAFPVMAEAAGKWLAAPDGPRLATLELGGWDTHAGQGTEGGRLANNFTQLANGLQKLKESLGPVWNKTTVVAMTEFGRTAGPNGNNGTDHGTGGAMFIAGGRVNGGRVFTSWPGLARHQLYQERDLMPTTDIRSVMKGILSDLYSLPYQTLAYDIYPGSASAQNMRGLIRV